jgi:hypothetical protein
MRTNNLRLIPLNDVAAMVPVKSTLWLWDGLLHPGDIVLLTSHWKCGKTTLLCGLLQEMGRGTPFLERETRVANIWVVSEETASVWAERMQVMPVGPHARLLARPFLGRPTAEEWQDLIATAIEARSAGELDLLVVDPLASFLPGRCESDAVTMLESLQPLHAFTDCGGAVLLLHHPRKNGGEAGSLARGSGALLGFVDTSVELTRYSSRRVDGNRRVLSVQSRRQTAPDPFAYEWNPTTGEFGVVRDPRSRAFEELWPQLRSVLRGRGGAITPREVRVCWPADSECPVLSTIYEWLSRAQERKWVQREGRGTSGSPWRYRLVDDPDAHGDEVLPSLPPLPHLE